MAYQGPGTLYDYDDYCEDDCFDDYGDYNEEEAAYEAMMLNQMIGNDGGANDLYGEFDADDSPYDDDSDDDDPINRRMLEEYPEYSSSKQLWATVTFLRPKFDTQRRKFEEESKDVYWCLTNDFEEIEPGVWSGPWYWRVFGGDMETARKVRLKRLANLKEKKQQMKASMIRNVDEETFQKALQAKKLGNKEFQRKKYKQALVYYEAASKKLGSFGVFLEGDQRSEMVKLNSNKAECYLKMKQYTNAVASATEALNLNRNHVKSLLRRAKGNFYGASSDRFGINPMNAASALKDLNLILLLGGDGVKEADALRVEIERRVKEDTARIRS